MAALNAVKLDLKYNCLDFKRAVEAPHAQFILRIMMAVNDLSTLKYLGELREADELSRPELRNFSVQSLAYILRMQQSHLTEAVNAFVFKIQAIQAEPAVQEFYGYIKADQEIYAIFEELATLARDPKFKCLEELRNNIAFHYNTKNAGARTRAAAKTCLHELNARKPQDPVHGWVMSDFDGNYFRFLIADEVANTAWRCFLGEIPDSTDYKQCTKTQSIKEFIAELGGIFILFGNELTKKWIEDNQLAKAHVQPPE